MSSNQLSEIDHLSEGGEQTPQRPSRPKQVLARLREPRSWTLRSKLVASMLVLFAVVTLVTGAATTVALRNVLYSQLDSELRQSLQRPQVVAASCTQSYADRQRGPGNEGLVAFATYDQAQVAGCASDRYNNNSALSSAQLDLLFSGAVGVNPVNVNLGGDFGSYRVMAAPATLNSPNGTTTTTSQPGTKVVGLPLSATEATLSNMVFVVTAGIVGGLFIVGLAGTYLVRRNLAPLTRVATTAQRVAHLPLSTGKVALVDRVPAEDTDTRTEVGQVGAAFNEMLDHVDEALNERFRSEQRVRQFVADASHELRTPLASIRGYAELTRREEDPVPASVTHAIGRVESEATRMSSLVEDLLLLARLDAGRPLEEEEVDLSEMVVNAVSDAHAASPDHVWQLDLPNEPVEVTGDKARLHQVVANLLANARTHTAPGTTVLTKLAHEGDHVRVSVQDDGPGVPESLQPNVFMRFARGDSSRNRAAGSTGLGLSIVAAVAQAHGGTVELDSKPGNTTFSVLLPV